MHNLFSPHPFSTTVGILTERATDSGQSTEDWSLFLEICDTINETDEGPKEAIRAIRKRLSSSAGRDHTAVWYTLLLLDTCIQHCGRRFHSQVANKEFLHDFLKLLSPKNEPSQQLQNQVLYMLKTWVEYNWDVPGKRDMEKIYTTLRQKGIQFPQSPATKRFHHYSRIRNKDAVGLERHTRESCASMRQQIPTVLKSSVPRPLTAIPLSSASTVNNLSPCTICCTNSNRSSNSSTQNFSPTRPPDYLYEIPIASQSRYSQRVQLGPADVHSQPKTIRVIHNLDRRFVPTADAMQFDADGTVRHLSSTQRIKLTQDLSVVETNVNVLNDMLAELRPDTVSDDDLLLLQELNETCRAMHRRVIQFLSQVSDEEVTPSLLQVCDNLNSAFLRYDRFERYRQLSLHSCARNVDSMDPPSFPAIEGRRATAAITGSQMLAITDKSACNTTTDGVCSTLNGLPECSNSHEDDDEPLIDIGDGAEVPRTSIDCDELAEWLSNRQLVPVSVETSTSNRTNNALLSLQQGIESMAIVPTRQGAELSSSNQAARRPPAQNNSVQSVGDPRLTAPKHSSTENLLFL